MKLAVASLIAMAVVAACGGSDGGAEPTPSASRPTSTSGSSVSTEPAWPTLSDKQKAAVEQALDDYDEGDRVVSGLQADPLKALADEQKLGNTLRTLFFSPAYSDQLRTIKELADKGIHLEGSSKIEWRVPTAVDLESDHPSIELQQCLTRGTLKVLQGSKSIKQDASPKLQAVIMKPHYEGTKVGFWRVADLKGTGSC